MDNAELAHAPTYRLAELIAAKEVSPVEATQLYLDRIEAMDSQLNSYLTVTAEEALEAARSAEEQVARGGELGPLHGVPIGIKDLQMTKGIRTTGGSLAYKDRVPDADSAVVERVLASGAIILGKTNTPEFGLLGANENLLGDDCRNPWNPERTSGASSGGAGAAVAAGLSSIATGGDGGGSIRIPASFCGIYGIKPSQGRVSSFSGVAAHPLANYTSQQGPMSRTVRDSAILLQALAGHDPRDVNSLRDPVPDFVGAVDRGVDGLRVGYSADYGYAAVDPEVAAICERAAQVFSDLGCDVEESDLALESPFETWWTLFSTNAYASQGHLLADQSELLTWYARNAIEAGAKVSGVDYSRAVGERDRMMAQFAEQLERFDILLSPTMAVPAFPVRQYPEEIAGRPVEPNPAFAFMPFTHPINVIGNAAATVPCGFSADGLPIGLHIVGRPRDEETVLAASAAFEQALPWIQHRPQVS